MSVDVHAALTWGTTVSGPGENGVVGFQETIAGDD